MSAASIRSFGFSIARGRLSRSEIADAAGTGKRKGERAICNHDEDSLTLGVQAALDAAGDGLEGIDRVVFATLSPPCVEKSNAALLAEACDAGSAPTTIDVAGSRRAGLLALLQAAEAIAAGRSKRALVVASDARPTDPGDTADARVGDAAVAFVLCDENDGALATLVGQGHAAAEVWDEWRREGEGLQTEDGRGIREAGFERPVQAAVRAAMAAAGASVDGLARLALTADAKAAAAMAKRLGVGADRVVGAGLADSIGDAGCAQAPLLLASTLDAGAGALVCVCGHGDGASALVFSTTAEAKIFRPASALADQIAAKRSVPYARRLLWRSRRSSPPEVSATLLAAESGPIMRLHAARCPHCNEVSYPPQTLCVSCGREGAKTFRLARKGTVYTFTRDALFEAPDPVTAVAVVDLEGGGRVFVQATDCDPKEIEIGTPVELVLRRIHDGGGHPNYSWKCRPIAPP